MPVDDVICQGSKVIRPFVGCPVLKRAKAHERRRHAGHDGRCLNRFTEDGVVGCDQGERTRGWDPQAVHGFAREVLAHRRAQHGPAVAHSGIRRHARALELKLPGTRRADDLTQQMRTTVPKLARPHAELMAAIDGRKGIPARKRVRAAHDIQKFRMREHPGIKPEQTGRLRICVQHPGRLQRTGRKPCVEIGRQPRERIGDCQLAEPLGGGHQADPPAALACFAASFAARLAGRTYRIALKKKVTDSRISTQASGLE